MEDCMINPPEEYSDWRDEPGEDPLDAYSEDEISLFMTDPEDAWW
jgi:hypothetical protein